MNFKTTTRSELSTFQDDFMNYIIIDTPAVGNVNAKKW